MNRFLQGLLNACVHVACVLVAFGRLLVDRLDPEFQETVATEVTIKGHSEIVRNEFAEAVHTIPEVLAAHFASGSSDFVPLVLGRRR